jgi:hypothetical protein
MYSKEWQDLDALVVPQSFIDSKKKVKISVSGTPGVRRQKLKGEIVGKDRITIITLTEIGDSFIVCHVCVR